MMYIARSICQYVATARTDVDPEDECLSTVCAQRSPLSEDQLLQTSSHDESCPLDTSTLSENRLGKRLLLHTHWKV